MEFKIGDYIVYEYKNPNTGIKYTCNIVGEKDGWILDSKHGTFESSSFRPDDVIVWEVRKFKSKDQKKHGFTNQDA